MEKRGDQEEREFQPTLEVVGGTTLGGGNFQFVYRVGSRAALQTDEFTQSLLDELCSTLVNGLTLNKVPFQQSLPVALTNGGAFLHHLLEAHDDTTANLKCILASTSLQKESIRLSVNDSPERPVQADSFADHFALVADLSFASLRMLKAGSHKLNIFRVVHCLDETRQERPYFFAIYTVLLELCLFLYISIYALRNPPRMEDVTINIAFAVLVAIYEVLIAFSYITDSLHLSRTAFWDNRLTLMRVGDYVANILIPLALVPISLLAILHAASDTLSAALITTSILFIPVIDSQVLLLIRFRDAGVVKKYVTRRALGQLVGYFYGHSEHEGGQLMGVRGSGFTHVPHMDDLVIAGAAMQRCCVFEAWSHATHASPSILGRGEFQEIYFSQTRIITPRSLFGKAEFKVEPNEPFAVVYLKLWRYGAEASLCQEGEKEVLEFYGERFQNHYPTQTIQGCILITNLKMDNGCIETLRMCRASDGVEFLQGIDFYTLFELGEVSRRILEGPRLWWGGWGGRGGRGVGVGREGWWQQMHTPLRSMEVPPRPMQMPGYQSSYQSISTEEAAPL